MSPAARGSGSRQAASVVLASIQHRMFVRALPVRNLPAHYAPSLALWMSLSISLLGLALAAYLVSVRPRDAGTRRIATDHAEGGVGLRGGSPRPAGPPS